MKAVFPLLFLIAFSITVSSQVSNPKDSIISIPFIPAHLSFQVPRGDLAFRFGNNGNVGTGFGYKTDKNWILGINGSYLFGNRIKEDNILDNIKTVNGDIFTSDGIFADIHLLERGFSISGQMGKVFSKGAINPNSGFLAMLGAGFIQHKIRIDVSGGNVPQLSNEYKKGYDRMSNGVQLSAFAGYIYVSSKKISNFYGGFEFIYGITQNRRYNFDQMAWDKKIRADLLFGIRFGWIIPLYGSSEKVFYGN